MKKSPTVVDVARLAGVGPSTVSRFLRGASISKQTAGKVESAIKETGYQPDEAARALRVGRSSTLGVIIPKISNAFFSQCVQLLEERARDVGYSVMLLTHLDRLDEQARQLRTLRRCRVDGVLLTAAPGTSRHDVREVLGDTPVVAFDAFISREVDTVVLQNRVAARLATEHLLTHGYKRIAAVSARPEIYSFRERTAGFAEQMQAHSLTPELLVGSDYDELRYLLRSALTGPRPPEALLSLSDFATLNVIRIYDELRLKPAEWIPLLGFDDFVYAPLLGVPITVIRQPIDELVRTALNLLLRLVRPAQQNQDPRVIQIPGELVRRRSCGCT